jgi:hypothetical protein
VHGEYIRNGCRRVNIVEVLYAHINGKMISAETIPGMGREEDKG